LILEVESKLHNNQLKGDSQHCSPLTGSQQQKFVKIFTIKFGISAFSYYY